MAEIRKAIPFLLLHEGGYSNVPGDSGGETKYGITESVARAHGYNGPMKDLPIETAADIYKQSYWMFDGLESQAVATKIFDIGVNMGTRTAVMMAQNAANLQGKELVVDGSWGPKTESAVNECDPQELIQSLCSQSVERYQHLVLKRPINAKFLKGWLVRSRDIPSIV